MTKIFPNPIVGINVVVLALSQSVTGGVVELYYIECYRIQDATFRSSVTFDTSALATGIFVAEITMSRRTGTRKTSCHKITSLYVNRYQCLDRSLEYSPRER